ncbi:L-lactate dehydrogenase A [Cocos nucifera]|uniref:L-lactate dehydrogenase A n=1 Tax=Cocos nucifera TaxID=13894 RepID=A0A8K0N5U8_COCNU|nr:L-lactate dehydrogenase A [Cocos nucifera]
MKKVSSLSELGLGDDVSRAFFRPLQQAAPPSPTKRQTKISVIGTGNVGMAIAQTILTQDLADELALVDAKPDKLRGEMLDLQHAAAFLPRTKIRASPDYAVTTASDLCIITAGARQIAGESRLDLVQRNLALFREIVPPLVRYSPDALLLVVSNPVDVLTYIAWKLSGFPPNRVIGSGTNLDSSRFRFLLADHLEVNAQDVQIYHYLVDVAYLVTHIHCELLGLFIIFLILMLGCDIVSGLCNVLNSVALWSSISVGGVPVLSSLEKHQIAYEEEVLESIRKAVVESAYEVIRLKGYTSWAIGYSAASLARSLLRDQHSIHPVSLLAKGFYGIPDDREVFLSLPARLGRGGVLSVANVHLTDEESNRLRSSAATLWEIQQQLGI